MSFNFFEMISKYNQFKNWLNKSGKNPEELLNEELKRRNISSQQFEEMKKQAEFISKMLGMK